MYLLLDTSATNNNFFITMYFIYKYWGRLKFTKFSEYLKNKPQVWDFEKDTMYKVVCWESVKVFNFTT